MNDVKIENAMATGISAMLVALLLIIGSCTAGYEMGAASKCAEVTE